MITLDVSEHAELATIQAELLVWFQRNGDTRKTVAYLVELINGKRPGAVVFKQAHIAGCSIDKMVIFNAYIVVDEYFHYESTNENKVSSFILIKNYYGLVDKMLTQSEFIILLRNLWRDIVTLDSPISQYKLSILSAY